jgi:hypothetical protein
VKDNAWRRGLVGLVLALLLAWPAGGFAREVPIITGEHWTKSSMQERKAFLIGAATIMELEQEVQGTPPPPPDKSLIDVWCRGLSHFTFDEMVKAIDDWYAGHPDKLSRPVVEVMWYELAEPNAAKKP